ncbi:29998_t:CDS:2, partial [Gigaspora margarita]
LVNVIKKFFGDTQTIEKISDSDDEDNSDKIITNIKSDEFNFGGMIAKNVTIGKMYVKMSQHPILDYFSPIRQNIFKCKLCSKEYNSEHTIDALKKHFSRKHYQIWDQIKSPARQSFTTGQQSSQVVGQQSSQVVGQQSSQVVGQPIKNTIDTVKTNYKLNFEDAVFNFNTREISAKKIILEM